MSDLNAPDLPVTERGDGFQEFDELFLQPEVRQRRLRPWAIVAAHPKLLNYFRMRREDRLATPYQQAFDAAERMLLAQINEITLCLGKR